MTELQADRIIALLERIAENTATTQRPATDPATRAVASAMGGAVFPNYGKRRGEPVVGASLSDLEFYANGCRRSLQDPGKSRWHDKERALLATIEAEIARQGGGDTGGAVPHDDDLPF